MIGDFLSRLYLPSAAYLNLVNADFFFLAFFFRADRGMPFYLAVAQILIMGTAAMTLLAVPLLLGT